MKALPNFEIQPQGTISKEFLNRKIRTFHDATVFVKNLDYGRNANKDDLRTVFSDNRGTCSTKHALLKMLADENNCTDVKLILGIFKMNGNNTPQVRERLRRNNLEYIPEGHNYLKFRNEIFDFTKPGNSSLHFVSDLLFEIEIQPDDIQELKIHIHKRFLKKLLESDKTIKFSLEELWEIREQCIQDLTENTSPKIQK